MYSQIINVLINCIVKFINYINMIDMYMILKMIFSIFFPYNVLLLTYQGVICNLIQLYIYIYICCNNLIAFWEVNSILYIHVFSFCCCK